MNGKGSSISFEDYAIALADEVEKPKHLASALHRRLLILLVYATSARSGRTLEDRIYEHHI